MKPTLKLKIRQLRELQAAAGISNILKPSGDDLERMLTLDFLTGFVWAGTEYLGAAAPDPEEMELSELLAMFQAWQAGGSDDAGKREPAA